MILLAVTPAEAHCFSQWHYPWRQNCHAVALAPPSIRRRETGLTPPKLPERIEIPLPGLEDIDWGKVGDEHLLGIALLRGLRNGP
jgi:hypothetical protein